MIRELGSRMREYAPCSPTAAGGPTTLIDAKLKQYMPLAIAQLNAWVYACPGADAANVGKELRASSWDGNTQLNFYVPWATNPTTGPYDIHFRFQRARILEAINDGVGQLGLSWYREAQDESLLTATNTWRYTLPNSQNWSQVRRVEIQFNTDVNNIGYPYADASYLNWRARRSVTTGGVEVWYLDFGLQPPPGRTLRVFGEAWYPDLQNDTDTLALAGEWIRPALSWIYAWGQFSLTDWTTNAAASSDLEKTRQRAMDTLNRQKEELLALAPAHKPGRIVTPGQGDAMAVPSRSDGDYLGVFKGTAFTH